MEESTYKVTYRVEKDREIEVDAGNHEQAVSRAYEDLNYDSRVVTLKLVEKTTAVE